MAAVGVRFGGGVDGGAVYSFWAVASSAALFHRCRPDITLPPWATLPYGLNWPPPKAAAAVTGWCWVGAATGVAVAAAVEVDPPPDPIAAVLCGRPLTCPRVGGSGDGLVGCGWEGEHSLFFSLREERGK